MPRPPDPRRFQPLKTDEFLILTAVAASPAHGYGIMKDVEARSEGQVVLQTGALYRILRRLLDAGLIDSCAPPAGQDRCDARRRYYEPSALGRAVLDAEVQRMSTLVRAARLAASGRRSRLV